MFDGFLLMNSSYTAELQAMDSLSVNVLSILGSSESSPQYAMRNPTCFSYGLGS